MAERKGFENLEPIFGDAEPEVEHHHHHQLQVHPFLFYVHALNSDRIEIIASDFHSQTFSRILTVLQLDDLRDDIGIGGSWSEFVDYLIASLSSGKVKLAIGGVLIETTESGEVHAKLIAHKSKGLPRISIILDKLFESSANDATARMSHALFKAFKEKQNDSIVEHERLLQVEGLLSSEKEISESLQKQLDGLSFNKKRKMNKSKLPDKASIFAETVNDKNTSVSETQPPSGVPETQQPLGVLEIQPPLERPSSNGNHPIKVSKRAAPMSRRAKTRGVSLHDIEDCDN